MSSSENPPRPRKAPSAEIPPVEKSPVEKQSDEPIVMLNPVLNRIAGLKEKKKPKEKSAPTRRKSISEGGVAYVPMVLENAFDEPTETEIGKPEPIYMGSEEKAVEVLSAKVEIPPASPPSPEGAETRYGITKEFKKAVISLEIERQMLRAEETLGELRQLEAEANFDFFSPGRSVQERIVDAENRLFGFKEQKKKLELNLLALDSIAESAPHATFYRDIKPVIDLRMEERISQMEPPAKDVMRRLYPAGNDNSKGKSKKRFASLRAAIAAVSLFGIGTAGLVAADLHTAHAGQPRAERVVGHEKFPGVGVTVKADEGWWEVMHRFLETLKPFDHKADAPEIIKHLLLVKQHPHALTDAFGFTSENGKLSRMLHPGDKLSVNVQGQLVFEPLHGKPHIILENVQPGKLGAPNKLTGKLYEAHHHAAPHPIEHANHHPIQHQPNPAVPYKVTTTHHGATYTPQPPAHPVEAAPVAPVAPESAPSAHAPVPTPAPVEVASHPAAAPTAEVVSSTLAPAESSGDKHYFAAPGESKNPHNIDLSVPTILFNGPYLFARGADTDDSFKRAISMSEKLFKLGREDTRVFFVAMDRDSSGTVRPVVRAVYQPLSGGVPQLWSPSDSSPMPALPSDEMYTAVPDSLLN